MKVVMTGATGAVGSEVVNCLLAQTELKQLTLLGRRTVDAWDHAVVEQQIVDVLDATSYTRFLMNHDVAICTLGVGEPSKTSREEFKKIDHDAVIDFATACKQSGVAHFELLASVGISATSRNYYLRSKGELVEKINKLNFNRFSVFEPSMILTPTNRYGFSQAIALKLTPLLKPILLGGFRKYRGVPVDILGKAMALNVFDKKSGQEHLHWDDYYELVS